MTAGRVGAQDRAGPRDRIGSWLGAIAGVVALQLACVPLWHLAPLPLWLLSPGAFLVVAAAVLTVSVLVPRVPLRWLPFALVPVAVLGAIALVRPAPQSLWAMGLVTAALLSAGTVVGSAVGGRVGRAEYLLVIAYISALGDIYSVLAPSGMTAKVVEQPRLLSLLALPWPLPEPDSARVVAVPLLGVGDVIMSALYLTATRQLQLGLERSLIALATAFLVVVALLLVLKQPLPALPVLGLAIVLAHPSTRHLPQGERGTAIAGMGLATLLFGASWWLG